MLSILKKLSSLLLSLSCLISSNLPAAVGNTPKANKFACSLGENLYDQYPYAALYYYGITGSDAFARMVKGEFHRWPEHIQSFELAYTLNKQNIVRRFFYPIVGVVQINANLTIRNGSNEPTIYEFDPYIAFRWANWPWNQYLVTSFAAGEGISYATSIPSLEKNDSSDNKRLLNYMMLEATFALPQYPRFQAVIRVHHRSGAFGLYGAGNTGSNDIGLGIKYLFD